MPHRVTNQIYQPSNHWSTDVTAKSDPARPAILIPERFEPLMVLSKRTTGSNSKQAVFPAAFNLLCFAAAVGFDRNRKGNVSANSNDKTVGGEVVMTDAARADRVLCDMIAVAATDGDQILETGRLQERLDIFMEYACGGLEYLAELQTDRTARDAVEAIIRQTDRDESIGELKKLLGTDGGG
jgi:dnd system-associated protein 4